jgi:hypothetical protein
MINVTNRVMRAWYTMLNGNISVPVYRVDAPASEEGNFVLLRVESETDRTNNAKFVTNPVIITEVVTKYKVAIKDGDAADIDSEIATLLFPSIGQLGLPAQSDIQITEVKRTNATYLPEDDGTFRYHRLITRNNHRVVQLASSVITLGAELIINGGFDGNATGWTLGGGWSYNNNNVLFNYASTNGELTQSGGLSDGTSYRVSVTIGGTLGSVAIQLHGGASRVYDAGAGLVSFDGVYIGPGTAGGVKIRIKPTSDFDGTIDNVSVKEIL